MLYQLLILHKCTKLIYHCSSLSLQNTKIQTNKQEKEEEEKEKNLMHKILKKRFPIHTNAVSTSTKHVQLFLFPKK